MFVAIKDNKPIAWSDGELEVDTDGVTYVETDDVLTPITASQRLAFGLGFEPFL